MGKLLKWEFKKQSFSKLILAVLLAIGELYFFYSLVFDKKDHLGLSTSLLFVFTIGALVFVSFESIITYSGELKNKTGYMLFMTPKSMKQIVGAKFISAGLQVVVVGLACFFIGLIDVLAVFAKYSSLKELVDQVQKMFNIQIQASDVFVVVMSLIVSWLATLALAFLAITLSTTFLANKKIKGIASFGIYMLINILFSKFQFFVISFIDNTYGKTYATIALAAVFSVVCYFVTSYMLEKRVSL